MDKTTIFISIISVILALKTTSGLLTFKKKLYVCLLFLFYITIGIVTGLFVERISFAELIGFVLKPGTLIFISGLQAIIAIIMIIFGLGKISENRYLNKYGQYFSIVTVIPCPFTLAFLALTISYFQKVIVGASNIGISAGCVMAYFVIVGLLSTLALRSRYFPQIVPKTLTMLGFLFIAVIFFLPMLLSNQDLISNGGGIMHTLTQILYLIANAHLIPVIVALIFLFCLSLILVGRNFAEYLERKENIKKTKECWQALEEFGDSKNKIRIPQKIFELFQRRNISGYLGKFLQRADGSLTNELKLRKIIDDLELDMSHRVERMVLATRIGPILGLMGTLIPMGPALTNLAAGNLGEMANQMVVAFTTTVLGLTVGGVSYFISIVRRRWYLQDLNNIEYLYEIILSHSKQDTSKTKTLSVNDTEELPLEAR